MKRIFWQVLSLICVLTAIAPITLYALYTTKFEEVVEAMGSEIENTVFIVICILALVGGFTMDSWWKKDNPALGYEDTTLHGHT